MVCDQMEDHVTCADGQCVEGERCDYFIDCQDASDEQECSKLRANKQHTISVQTSCV